MCRTHGTYQEPRHSTRKLEIMTSKLSQKQTSKHCRQTLLCAVKLADILREVQLALPRAAS
eukprot:2644400-Pleurochrysis_carterae.AAC.1